MLPHDEIVAVDEIIERECPPNKRTQAFMVYIDAMAHGPHNLQLSDRENYERNYLFAVREMRDYINGDKIQSSGIIEATRLTDAA